MYEHSMCVFFSFFMIYKKKIYKNKEYFECPNRSNSSKIFNLIQKALSNDTLRSKIGLVIEKLLKFTI